MEDRAAPLLEATEAMIQAIDRHLDADVLGPLPGSIACPLCYESPTHIEEHMGKLKKRYTTIPRLLFD